MLRNWLAGSKTVVSTSRNHPVTRCNTIRTQECLLRASVLGDLGVTCAVCCSATLCVWEPVFFRPPLLTLAQLSNFVCRGFLRLVGSFKSQVSFAKYRLFYRALLQKRPMILRSLLIVATPLLVGSLHTKNKTLSRTHIKSRSAVCCSVLQCVAVCCSVLQCAAVCCSVLRCVAVCCSVSQ